MRSHFTNLRLVQAKNGDYYVSFYLEGKRYRFFNSSTIGTNLYPNKTEAKNRKIIASKMLLDFNEALGRGWIPNQRKEENYLLDALKAYKIDGNLSKGHQRILRKTIAEFVRYLESQGQGLITMEQVDRSHIGGFLNRTNGISPSTFNHERAYISSVLEDILIPLGYSNPVRSIKKKRTKEVLHKPFTSVRSVLEEVQSFNENLFLCCLLTYGCLLRPHREIRNLKWEDFSDDLSYISLSGSRNKSGRNRIVPVTAEVRKYLTKGEPHHNIFTGTEQPYNECYFKTLWSRFKGISDTVEPYQTLYSFRHSGAINVYLKTQSLSKLQYIMGHSSPSVTQGYLRHLELPHLEVRDMPDL